MLLESFLHSFTIIQYFFDEKGHQNRRVPGAYIIKTFQANKMAIFYKSTI